MRKLSLAVKLIIEQGENNMETSTNDLKSILKSSNISRQKFKIKDFSNGQLKFKIDENKAGCQIHSVFV